MFFQGKEIKYIPRPVPTEPSYEPPSPPIPDVPQAGDTPSEPSLIFTYNVTLKLYKVYDDEKVVNKNLNNELTFNIALKKDVDILTPEIILDTDTNITGYNYAYIDIFDRYYYVSIETLQNELYKLKLSVDHLVSWKDEIYNLDAIIDKQEFTGNQYINDGSFVVQSDAFNEVYNFASGFNDSGEFILITAGG